jgi:hypothetical protein
MPKKPPKQWWNKCIKGVSKSGKAYDPESICGDIWYHKKSKKEKITITRRLE